MEKDWINTLLKLKQSIIFCPLCNEETFFNMKKDSYKCMCCGNTVSRPARLTIGKSTIPLQPTLKLLKCEIDSSADLTINTLKEIYGEVIVNTKDPTIWGLRNKSTLTWYRKTPGGKEFNCEPNGTITIVRDNIINFGTLSEGKIE